MQKMQNLIFSLLIVGSTLMTSCNNDDETPTPEPAPTNKELIIGSWATSKAEAVITGGNDNPVDLTAFDPDCAKDNLIVFEEKNVFRIDEGAIECNESRTQVGTWFMNDEETEVISLIDEEITAFSITEITETTAVFTQKIDIDDDGTDDIITLTLAKEEE